MTTKKIPSPLRPGDQFHALVDGVTFSTSTTFMGGGHVTRRGETYVLTDELIAANTNRLGETWLAIVHDEAAQLARWGAARFAPGPWPSDEPTWVYGSREWAEAREVARLAAWQEPDPQTRMDKLAEVEKVFGPGAPTSRAIDYRRPEGTRAARTLADDLFAREQSGQRHIVKSS